MTDEAFEAGVITSIREEMNRLRGRSFQAIEATGMPAKQESAVKAVLRSASYDAQAHLEAAVRRSR